MSNYWLKGSRVERVAQAESISAFLKANKDRVGITDPEITAYDAKIAAAKTLLEQASLIPDRTIAMTAKLREAFTTLAGAMVKIKRQYLTVPPLVDYDLVLCQLRPADTTPTEVRTPNTSCTIKPKTLGPGVIRLDFDDYGNLPPEVRNKYGVRYYWGIMLAETVLRLKKGGEPTVDEYKAGSGPDHYLLFVPSDGDSLPHSQFTGRKRDVLVIKKQEGNTLYLCARYETPTGEPSPWGPVARIIIT